MNHSRRIAYGKWLMAISGVILFSGIVLTIKDYQQWKRLETEKYGQGWKDLVAEAQPLTEETNIGEWGLAIRLPDNVKIKYENEKIYIKNNKDREIAVLKIGEEGETGIKKVGVEEPGGRVFVVQTMGKRVGDKIVMMETRFGEEEWGQWQKTVEAIFESIKLI